MTSQTDYPPRPETLQRPQHLAELLAVMRELLEAANNVYWTFWPEMDESMRKEYAFAAERAIALVGEPPAAL